MAAVKTMGTILFLVLQFQLANAQSISGFVLNASDSTPVAFANIGISGKNIGTVSAMTGHYELTIDPEFVKDSLVFSSIGYETLTVSISDLMAQQQKDVWLAPKITQLQEVVIKPGNFTQKALGVFNNSPRIAAGFKDNDLGYELGILMKNKKAAYIKQVNFNISHCTYDTIFYRLNIYRATKGEEFENILHTPIYIERSRDQVKEVVSIDLRHLNLFVEGDFLVSLEHVKDLGEGSLYFCAAPLRKTHYRKTSHAHWQTVAVGVSINVLADVEK